MDIDPEILDELERERNYAKSGGSNTSRLKLDKDTAALVRFLPVKLGTNNSWFGRVGLHWIGKRPINCPRSTSPAFGGNPESECPVCQVVEKLSAARNKDAQTAANKAASWPQWLTYVLVFETYDTRNRVIPTPKQEVWIPNEFWMPKTGWLDLSSIYQRKLERSGVNIVDPIHGYDILVSKNARGDLKFELDKQGPLADMAEAELRAWVEKLCTFRTVDTSPASIDKLEEAALKLEDFAYGGSRRGEDRRGRGALDEDDMPVRGRGRGRGEDEDVPYDSPRRADEFPSRGAAGAPGYSRTERQPEQAPEPPTAARAEPPPARSEPPPAVRTETPPERTRAELPPRRSDPQPPTQARRELEPPPARRQLPPEDRDASPEAVPPEIRDPAPPGETDEPPPPFPTGTAATPPPTRNPRVSDAMADSLRRVSSRRP
jgi:hypothetical protein